MRRKVDVVLEGLLLGTGCKVWFTSSLYDVC